MFQYFFTLNVTHFLPKYLFVATYVGRLCIVYTVQVQYGTLYSTNLSVFFLFSGLCIVYRYSTLYSTNLSVFFLSLVDYV